MENSQADSQPKVIGTHDGTFHCDEAFACYLLQKLPEYKDATIVRTRDPAKLKECDIVVDVGAVFDPAKHLYDHHQREFSHSFNSLDSNKKWTTKLSSAGLVYFHFGRQIIKTICGTNDEITEILFDQMYENFVEEIDAIDNGISQYEGSPKYRINSTVGSRVGRLNPSWIEEDVDPMSRFQQAMKLVGTEFDQQLKFYHDAWLPAREYVIEALNKRKEVDESGDIIVIDSPCPWKTHLFMLEKELSTDDEAINVKYALFTDSRKKWRVMAVPIAPSSFTSRLALPAKWRGIRDQDLSTLSGIDGCIFVHAAGFIGGNETFEGALAMARASLKMAQEE